MNMQTVTLRMPAVDVKFLDALSKRMGWEKVPQTAGRSAYNQTKPSAKGQTIPSTKKKKTGLELAIEDVQKGNLHTFQSVDALMAYLNS